MHVFKYCFSNFTFQKVCFDDNKKLQFIPIFKIFILYNFESFQFYFKLLTHEETFLLYEHLTVYFIKLKVFDSIKKIHFLTSVYDLRTET